MKKFILLLSILYWNTTYAQFNCVQAISTYFTTYNYIINDSINHEKRINICDSLVKLNIAVFWRELRKTDENENVLFRRLYNIYHEINSVPNLTRLTKNEKEFSSIVFFSPILNDSILCAEVFDNKKNNNETDYDKIAYQNQSHFYLFIINAMGTIKSVFRKEMIYD